MESCTAVVKQRGADVNLQDNQGENAYTLAIRGKYSEIVAFLQDYINDVSKQAGQKIRAEQENEKIREENLRRKLLNDKLRRETRKRNWV